MRSVLAIAGSDSAGCAGLQTDLKTIAAFGLHGLSVVTAVTAQNNRRVESIHRVPSREVAAQLRAVFTDFPVAAAKVGMPGSAAATSAIAKALQAHAVRNVVVDPVLMSSSGTMLQPAAALRAARRVLYPLATLLTPNVPEAETLLGRRIRQHADLAPAARDLLECGAHAVLLKGGHLPGARVRDVLVDTLAVHEFVHERLPFTVRGTGCALASAIACGLALGQPLGEAVNRAQQFLQIAMRRSRRVDRSPSRALGVVEF